MGEIKMKTISQLKKEIEEKETMLMRLESMSNDMKDLRAIMELRERIPLRKLKLQTLQEVCEEIEEYMKSKLYEDEKGDRYGCYVLTKKDFEELLKKFQGDEK